MTEEQALVQQARQGDEGAFAALVEPVSYTHLVGPVDDELPVSLDPDVAVSGVHQVEVFARHLLALPRRDHL